MTLYHREGESRIGSSVTIEEDNNFINHPPSSDYLVCNVKISEIPHIMDDIAQKEYFQNSSHEANNMASVKSLDDL